MQMDPCGDSHLYQGASSTRGLLCIAPSLEKFVGDELAKEALAQKERKKAAEERCLVKKGLPKKWMWGNCPLACDHAP